MTVACCRNGAFMGSSQLIQQETKMEFVHFKQRQLAARSAINDGCP
jgi:hypothetical protein